MVLQIFIKPRFFNNFKTNFPLDDWATSMSCVSISFLSYLITKLKASGSNWAYISTKGVGKTKTQNHFDRLSAMPGCHGLPSASQGGLIEWCAKTPEVQVSARWHRTYNFWDHTFYLVPACAMQQTTLDTVHFCWLTGTTCQVNLYPTLNHFYHQLHL